MVTSERLVVASPVYNWLRAQGMNTERALGVVSGSGEFFKRGVPDIVRTDIAALVGLRRREGLPQLVFHFGLTGHAGEIPLVRSRDLVRWRSSFTEQMGEFGEELRVGLRYEAALLDSDLLDQVVDGARRRGADFKKGDLLNVFSLDGYLRQTAV